MSAIEKLRGKFSELYIDLYGDRIRQISGNILSVKIEEKSTLWILKKITIILMIKPDKNKSIIQCRYIKTRFFKKPSFIKIKQGNKVVIQGLAPDENKDKNKFITILNIKNVTTKTELYPMYIKKEKKKK